MLTYKHTSTNQVHTQSLTLLSSIILANVIMASPSFSESLSYALSSLQLSHLSLKVEQRSSMEAIYE